MFLATHGVLRRSSGFVPPVFADNYSFEYDGVSDCVQMGDVLNFERTSAFSISAWVKRGGTGVNDTIVSKMESSGNFRGYLLFIKSSNNISFVLRNANTSSNRLFVDSTSTITDTNWHHIIMTYDGSSSVSGVKIYIDGVSDTVTTAGTLSATTLNSSPFNIGARNSSSLFATAKIDEPAIFDYALTSTEVSNIYGIGVPTSISSLNPIGHWRAENATFDGSNWNITDAGSGGNNATSVSMTSASRSTDVPLFDNKSFEYDGVIDYLEASDSDDLSFGNGSTDSPFSISAWIKPLDNVRFRIAFKWDSSLKEYYFQTAGGGALQVSLNSSSSVYIGRNGQTTISENVWSHVVFTYDGSGNKNNINIYLNGVSDNDSVLSSGTYTAMSNTTQSLIIGGYNDGSNANGLINEPAIFDYELTSTEVSNIYGSGVPTDISSLNPVGHWRAENGSWDGSKWTITDSGSGGNDAESVSMTLSSRTSDVPT